MAKRAAELLETEIGYVNNFIFFQHLPLLRTLALEVTNHICWD